MANIKTWFKKHFITGYSKWEIGFLWSMVALQALVFCINPDTPLNIIAGIAGVISVVLCAKGRTVFYYIGYIQNFTYMLLSFQNQFYGEVFEQVFYVITMIIGTKIWKDNERQLADGTAEVKSRALTKGQWVLSVAFFVVGTLGFGYFLEGIGNAQAMTDSATNVMAVIAQLLMMLRYREQWIWWLLIDLLCIKMWFVAGNWSMVAMYIAWTINCLYGWYNWKKLEGKSELEMK